MEQEDLTHKLELLRLLKRRKQILEKREAQFGSTVDPSVTIEREDLDRQLKALEREANRSSFPSLSHSPIRGLMNSSVILDVSRIIDMPAQVLEYHLGDPVHTSWRIVESAEDLPEGGETREYTFDDYAIEINYDKSGSAKGIRLFEGLEKYNYSLDDWPSILPRVGLLHVITLPDIRGITAVIWREYQGLTIKVASQRVGGAVTAVRIYKRQR